ncbi:response regulator transcription factor [bacterium 210820-DFI.6.37]|nr:response regulator transcription factor [bacterium 210820-DFI.6.37]
MTKIAVIEDDKLYNEALCISLKKEGYTVESGFSADDGKSIAASYPDLVILDLGLPDGTGIDVCRYIKGISDIPVIFLTARDEEADMIRAYDNGCDDYVVKPFPIRVLKKKVEAVLKRHSSGKSAILYKDLLIDCEKRTVSYKRREIRLSAREFELLEFLAKNKGQILSKETLLREVWDSKGMFVEENTVNVTINRLRKKIEPDVSNPMFINNIFGMGYKFGE